MGSTGQVILGTAGAVVGGIYGGPAGAQIGWSVGYAVGGIVDPQHISGPTLGESLVQTSRPGVPIPIIWGIQQVVGNVIQINPETRETSDVGGKKGTPETDETRVYRTFAIRFGRSFYGPIENISRIWENEKLVYDTRAAPAISAADTAAYAEGIRIYLGTELQLPDPDLEAHTGIGFTPAYRGMAYIVWVRKDLVDYGGSIPTMRVELNAGDGYQASSLTYPLEAIDAVSSGFTWISDETISPPIDFAEMGFSFQSATVDDILELYAPDPEGVDMGFAFTSADVKLIKNVYVPDPEGLDMGFAFISADVQTIRIDYTVDPEGVDTGFAFISGDIT